MPAHRKPTAVLAKRGAFKKDPKRAIARKHEPAPNGPIGQPPVGLTAKQLACWNELIANAPEGVLTRADRGVVELTARLQAQMRGKAKLSTSISQQLRSCFASLGMTPADRSRVTAPSAAPPKSPWDAIDHPAGADARTN